MTRTTKTLVHAKNPPANRGSAGLPESGYATAGSGKGRRASSAGLDVLSGQFAFRAILYLVAIVLAEFVTVLIDTRWGVAGHAVILAFLVTQAGVAAYRAGDSGVDTARLRRTREANFLVSAALVPLIRIVSLAMPLTEFPEWSWYILISVPLLAASWAAARACGFSREDLGLQIDLRPKSLSLAALVGAIGFGLGYVEFQILQPDPIVDRRDALKIAAAAFSLFIGTGFAEELVFRGLLQVSGGAIFGELGAIVYASALFATMHIGHKSALNVAYVFLVAFGFGLIVRKSRSLAGVIAAHSVTNICLYLIYPHYASVQNWF